MLIATAVLELDADEILDELEENARVCVWQREGKAGCETNLAGSNGCEQNG